MATVKKIRRSVAPFYGVAAVWVVYALAFDLYRPTHFIFAAVLSAGVYLLLRTRSTRWRSPTRQNRSPLPPETRSWTR